MYQIENRIKGYEKRLSDFVYPSQVQPCFPAKKCELVALELSKALADVIQLDYLNRDL